MKLWRTATVRWMLIVPSIVALAYLAPQYLRWPSDAPHQNATWNSQSGGDNSNRQPTNKEFVVQNSYKTSSGLILLGSQKDYKSSDNVTVVIDPKSVTCPDHKSLIGKSVAVTGFHSQYKGKPQITATSLVVK